MPYAVIKRACLLVDEEYSKHPTSNETMQVVKDRITVYPVQGDVPQSLPDWASGDALYKLGIKEGWIMEVSEQSAKAAQELAEKKKTAAQTEKQPVGLQQGWGGGKKN
jgi:hypothetical protein